jgi:hypothetical protein
MSDTNSGKETYGMSVYSESSENSSEIETIMEIGAPIWTASTTSYTFPIRGTLPTLESSPLYVEPSMTTIPTDSHPPTDTITSLITPLFEDFIEKSKKHFASALKLKTILSRLTHTWVPGNIPIETPGWYKAVWTPKEIVVKSREFVLGWTLTSLLPTEPIIPIEFLAAPTPRAGSPAEEVRTFQIQQTQGSVNGLEESEPDFVDSDIHNLTNEYEVSDLSLERRKVREARLRAALANLKAEKMAEKYYRKYGIQPGEESELSSDSEDEEEEQPF